MNPWFAKAALLAANVVMIVIRAPHGSRSRTVGIAENRRGTVETVLLTLAWLSFVIPLVWVASPVFAFADYPLRPVPFAAGTACFALGLWIFHLSHRDLGTNWSITLQVRENHTLVTNGIYRKIRHPMYLSLLVYSLGQALAVPNWIAGPCYAVAMVPLVALRLGPEERMMADRFGAELDAYRGRTNMLIPGII
jgi:protein-S-isoprenylcysteine O-methyltransferase Ste14